MSASETLLLGLLAVGLLGALAPSGPSEPPGPLTTRLTLDELRALASSVGFPDEILAAAIAMAESNVPATYPPTANVTAKNIVTKAQADAYNAAHPGGPKHGPERSFGLWQINTLAHPTYDERRLLTDGTYNAQAAYAISNGGTNFNAWSTFTSGAYKAYMS